MDETLHSSVTWFCRNNMIKQAHISLISTWTTKFLIVFKALEQMLNSICSSKPAETPLEGSLLEDTATHTAMGLQNWKANKQKNNSTE